VLARMDLGTFDAVAQAKHGDALLLADRMDTWREQHGNGKIPD
jgi:hypothetical protein